MRFDPAPAWIQDPLIIVCFLLIGGWWGFCLGVLFEHWYTKRFTSLFRRWWKS